MNTRQIIQILREMGYHPNHVSGKTNGSSAWALSQDLVLFIDADGPELVFELAIAKQGDLDTLGRHTTIGQLMHQLGQVCPPRPGPGVPPTVINS